ncbi:hypothetical protein RAZWK3B_14748 [Roseobacter sp. AzwK-3b]|uniref:hypothetical protein n=1 Tax=Roseobacter sp. AzwK-3b TaxID=351016 RepID=UPI0001569D53|nr:hypothetical protein [Roseobacter sp. AzwK-3b]EDM70665.1 hypothetical protein RAZWK3B_14748 [Roseobacter sp. AzwK-3b]
MLACFKHPIAWRASLFAGLFSYVAFPSAAQEAQIFDYRLGDHIIDYPLSELDVVSSDLDGFDGQAFIKLNAPNATHLVLTFRQPRNTLQYLEHDWIDRDDTAPTALRLPGVSEFTFGQSRVSDVQSALGQQGFHYACRQLQPISGGLLTFISFEIPSRRNAVYTFVAEYSRDLAEQGLVDLENIDLTQAVLVAAIVSRPDYPDDFWCDQRIEYTATPAIPEQRVPENESFEDFLPQNSGIAETDPWELMTEPFLMVAKNSALTWGDRLYIIPDPADCSRAEFMVWAHTYDDTGLLALEGQDVDAAFNLLMVEQKRVPLEAPVPLTNALYAPIDGRDWPPFAVGSFVFGSFDFERIIAAEGDPSVFGFSLEFAEENAGMRDNFWSLEGLFEAGNAAIQLCQETHE